MGARPLSHLSTIETNNAISLTRSIFYCNNTNINTNNNTKVIGYMDAYRRLAVPGVLALISFLSFSSQYLFRHIDPEPLTIKETLIFNSLIAALLICYARSVSTDPGHIPSNWALESEKPEATRAKPRWCRKCEAVKPPRAHHCKICKRFVPSFLGLGWTSNPLH